MSNFPDLIWPSASFAVIGATVGSFVGAVVIRVPSGRGIVSGRSSCDACHAQLRARELVPILSYVVLRGRCRRCRSRIAPDQLLAELSCALSAALAAMLAPNFSSAAMLSGFGWTLITLALLDARHFWLPDFLTLPLMLAGLAAVLIIPDAAIADRVAGVAGGYGALELLRLGYRLFRKREGLGRGDPKLLGAIGAWLGLGALPLVVLLASILGLALITLRCMLGKPVERHDRLPLGVLLVLATFAVMPFQMLNDLSVLR